MSLLRWVRALRRRVAPGSNAGGGTPAKAALERGPAPATDAARQRYARIQDLFHQVLAVEYSEREGELQRLAPDPVLREEVRDLLRAHGDAGVLDELVQAFERPSTSLADVDAPGTQFAQYRLLESLGAGGMGVVYRAVDTRLDRTVALKFLSPSLGADPTAKQRFLAEARAAAALEHPNICTILEVGEFEDRLFIAMPYYKGQTVKELLKGGALGAAQAVPIAIEIGRGLAAAHASGVVHRDIKPANVIVREDGVPTIVDFGVAKVAQQRLTRTGVALGTISYMSPEQARGEAVDHRSDVWSLGVLLYEMITGTHPFPGHTDRAVQLSILTTDPESIAPHLDGATGLEQVVERALEKDVTLRWQSVQQMVAALQQIRVGSIPPDGSSGPRGGLMRKGERRQVSVLTFLLGEYDDLVDQLTPEAIKALVQQVRASVGDAVTAAGGFVHAMAADRIECIFGIPAAREDDALRAVRAALEARKRCKAIALDPSVGEGRSVSLRAAVDVGVVAVHLDPGEGGPYRIGRSLIERAARVASEAKPGALLVSAECYRVVRPFVQASRGPSVGLGHDTGTVSTYAIERLQAFTSSLEARASSGLTAFTGRGDEIGVLTEALADAVAGSGQIVTVSGNAGIGKSRLLYEFEHGVVGAGARVLHGRCQSYGSSVPYLPFLDVLRAVLGVDDEKAPAPGDVAERLQALGSELSGYLPYYLHILSIPSDRPLANEVSGDQLRLAIVESIAAVLTVASTSQPCALLLEDWHWADEASTAALLQLCELISSFPIMIIVTHRPGYGVTWQSIGHHRHLALAPLEGGHTRDIAISVLGAKEVEDELAARIQDRAQGNPFFVEEMCAALLEQGAIEIRDGRAQLTPEAEAATLPDSIQAVIRTRLDRMTPATREVLSAASVVGREFTRELVSRALGGAPDLEGALQRLRAGGLIQQTRLVPEATYRFKHALIQEVTYETLLGQQRRLLHRRVGEAMEMLDASNEEDLPFERLSDHFFRAEVWDKAVDYALGAARRASRVSQIPEALRALEVAEAALGHLEEHQTLQSRLDVLLMKERLSETTGERRQQRRIIAELRPLVARSGDSGLEAEVLVRAGDLEISLRNYGEAEEVLQEAVDKASRAHDPAMHRKALRSLGLLRWHQDRYLEALEILQGVLDEDQAAGDTEGMILDHHNLGSVHRSMGNIDRALYLAQESVRLAKASPFRQVYALHTVALCQRELGRMEEAIATWKEGIRLCEQHHLPLQGSYLTTSLAHLYLQMGRSEESVSLYEDAVERTRRVRHAEGLARAVSALARVLEGLGRPEEALPYWQEATTWFGRMEEHDRQAHAQSRVASILEGTGKAQRALAAWGQAHQMAGEGGHEDLEIESLIALARLTREHLGTIRLAVPYYESALEIARRRGWNLREGVVLNSLGVVAWESGDYERAREYYARAVECFEGTERTTALGHALNSLGQTLRKLGRLDEALETLEGALTLHRETGDARLEGYALAALGDTFLDRGEPRLALAAFENSLGLRHLLGDRTGAGWMAQRMAKSAHQLGQLDRVRELLFEATLIADELEDRELQDACSRLRP